MTPADMQAEIDRLTADLAALHIEHKAHAALLDITRRDRDEARQEIPRHIRIALRSAQRAFDDRDLRVFATFNEDLQPMVDAASAWITALRRDLAEARAAVATATAKGREMERADVLAGIGTLIDGYLSTHGGGGNYCLALEMARRHIEAGVYEGAAEKP